MEMEKVEEVNLPWWFHHHPLVLVEERSNQNKKASCSGCGEVVSGSSFTCVHCNYHLHKECAQAPFEIHNHPLHPQHSYLFLQERPSTYLSGYACALCKEKHNMFFYECYDCCFVLDIKCALSSHKVDESIMHEFKDDGHQHPFIFFENHKDELKNVYCSWCHESLTDSIYISVGCNFHKKCFDELPIKIDHPYHRLHTMFLQFQENNCFCDICQKEDDDNFFYHCFLCIFDVHLKCIWPKHIIEANRYHEHSFTLFCRKDSFTCDACGTDGKFVSYICHTCHLQVHESCISLPLILKVTRHDHAIFYKYFLMKREFEKHFCKICFEEVETEYGSYHCLKEDCNYIVHVKCAMEDDDLYYVLDQENQDEELDETNEATDSSNSFRAIEKNEHGEAIKIKHFSHEHNLEFEDKIKENNDKHCDGCMLSISTPFYYCSECTFFLHKTCAELPKLRHHWFHRFVATLEKGLFWCDLCRHLCSGLFYKSTTEYEDYNFCLRCAAVPNIIEGQRHEHFLYFHYKCSEECNACGVWSKDRRGAFKCKKCNDIFTLDFACMTLPEAIQHRCDNHLLKLSYHDENDEHYCDICEENRDPNHWYYYCSTCDNSVHPKCALGKYPFVKEGMTWPSTRHLHKHDVSFVRKVDGYPQCSVCGELCQDEALKCPKCNYIVHGKCGSYDQGWLPYW